MKQAFAILAILALTISSAYGQSTGSHLDIPVGRSWPRSIVVNPATNQVFVTTLSGIYPPTGFTITVIDAANKSIASVVPYSAIPGEMTIDVKTNTVYIVNSSSIVVFDGTSKRVTGSIQVEAPLYDVAFDPSTGLLYATSASNLYRINATQLRVIDSVPVGRYAEGIAINEEDDAIYVANFGSSSIAVVDRSAFRVTRTITLPQDASPSSMVYDTSTNKLFVTTGRNYLLAVDGSTGGVVASIEVGAYPTQNSTYALALDSNMNELFVASSPGTLITVIDTRSFGIITRVKLSYTPFEIASNSATGEVYVTNYHLVSVINSRNLTVSTLVGSLPPVFGISLIVIASAFAVWRWSKIRRTRLFSGR